MRIYRLVSTCKYVVHACGIVYGCGYVCITMVHIGWLKFGAVNYMVYVLHIYGMESERRELVNEISNVLFSSSHRTVLQNGICST